MDLLQYILENFLAPALIGIVDIFTYFDYYFPVSTILLSFFFVSCCYRFIISRFLNGSSFSFGSSISDAVKAHVKSDRAGNKQEQNDKGKGAVTSHSSD